MDKEGKGAFQRGKEKEEKVGSMRRIMWLERKQGGNPSEDEVRLALTGEVDYKKVLARKGWNWQPGRSETRRLYDEIQEVLDDRTYG